jgi:hypothetical protein
MKTSKRLISRCHVEKYSQFRVQINVWASWKIHHGAITSFSGLSEVIAQTAN